MFLFAKSGNFKCLDITIYAVLLPAVAWPELGSLIT